MFTWDQQTRSAFCLHGTILEPFLKLTPIKSNVTPLVSYGYPNFRVTVMIQFSPLLPTSTPP